MATAVYLLCALMSIVCAGVLIREYFRSHTTLLLWSSLSFACLAVSNMLVFTDFVLLPATDLSLARAASAAAAVALLLFGLVWHVEY